MLDAILLLNSAVLNVELGISSYHQVAAKKKDIFLVAKNIEIMDFVKSVPLPSTFKTMDIVSQRNVQ